MWVWEEFWVSVSETTVSRILRALGYRKLSARPRHHAQAAERATLLKKYGPPRPQGVCASRADQSTPTYPALSLSPGQDGDPRALVLINFTASSAIF